MKKILTLLLTVAMLFGCAAALTACGAPKDGGARIKVYLGDPVYDFDPTDYYVSDNAAQMMSLLYEPLFSVDARGRLQCAGAQKYEVNRRDRKIVITLRETYWSDGVRVRAADYLYAWRERVMEPNHANPAAALFYDIENAVEVKNATKSLYDFGARVSGIYEITLAYREGADPDALLRNLASVATAPVREDTVTKASAYWSKTLSYALFNGPFALSTYSVETGEFTLERNTGYHQEPNSKNATAQVTPGKLATFWSEGGAKTLTYSQITDKTLFYMGDASLETRAQNASKAARADTLSTLGVVLNTTKAPFDHEQVRRALSLALDRAAIEEAVTFGHAATGFLPAGVKNSANGKTFSVENRVAQTDVAAARALVSAADLTPQQKTFTLSVAKGEENERIASLAKAAWEAIGFTVHVEVLSPVKNTVTDFSTGTSLDVYDCALQIRMKDAALGVRDFDAILVDWQMYSEDALVALSAFTSTTNGNGYDFVANRVRANVCAWENETYDSLIAQAYAQQDKAQRHTLLVQAEKLLVEQAPFIPVLFGENFGFRADGLSAPAVDGFGNFIFTKVSLRDYQKHFYDAQAAQ